MRIHKNGRRKPQPVPSAAGESEREELLRLAVEAAPAGMLMTDEAGRITLVNSRAEAIFGRGRGELIGRPLASLLPEGFRAGTVLAVRKDGSEIPVEIALNPAATSAGRFTLISLVDITQRLILEKELAQRETLAEIGSMISVVAHEIRNPLGTIIMAAKAVTHDDLSREEHDQVVSLLTLETDRLNRTLKGILHFAKPREPKLERGDLNAATHEVLAAVRSGPDNAGKTEVREILDDQLPEILFDADQIRQVLWNVIINAFQALDGAGMVEVKTECAPGAAVVHVQDDGPGIPRDQLEKIFLPFFTTKAQGTGLGLPTSRSIVRAHGGDIRVESAPGRGSRFSIFIPASRDQGAVKG